jgi:hypothetical protein
LGVIAGVDPASAPQVDPDEKRKLLAAADLVTLARTPVDHDYRGDVVDAHAPEFPTRFAKQLTQVFRGAVTVGLDRPRALRLAIRCARDSLPPLRLEIVDDLAQHPYSTTAAVRKRLHKPRATVDRQLQALHILRVVDVDETSRNDFKVIEWRYTLAEGINPSSIAVPEIYIDSTDTQQEATGTRSDALCHAPSYISGTAPDDGLCRDCRTKPPAVNGRCAERHIIHVHGMARYDQ